MTGCQRCSPATPRKPRDGDCTPAAETETKSEKPGERERRGRETHWRPASTPVMQWPIFYGERELDV